jgi:hypothetical protein
MENIRRRILNKLSTFCYSELNLARGWQLCFFWEVLWLFGRNAHNHILCVF